MGLFDWIVKDKKDDENKDLYVSDGHEGVEPTPEVLPALEEKSFLEQVKDFLFGEEIKPTHDVKVVEVDEVKKA